VTDEKTSEDEAKDDAQESAPDDGASPEAIARRVAALGEEDQSEKLARDEERKLAERRAVGKKKTKKGGLEVAASKKLSKIGTRAEPKRTLAVAADADPLIEKTAKLSEWAKENQKTVQIVGAVLAAALLGVAGFLYFEHKHETEASVLLTKAVEDERARIGEPPKDDAEDKAPVDPSPMFKTFELRREAALTKYREVETRFPKTGAAILARLAEGSLLLDKHEPDPAAAAFNEVKSSPLAAADQEVKGRALEGLGFAYELKAQATPAEAPKFLDEAAKAYKELENTVDIRGFKELAIYHQARVAQNRGEKDKAKELLITLKDRLAKTEDNTSNIPQGPSFPYLKEVAMDRLREIDPSAAPSKAQPTTAGGNPSLSPAQIRKMIEDAQKKQKSGGAPPGGDRH
jgi:predicted negative regulator of RcsB-dependent stress response